ncbi:MAG: Fic family protein [Elusimicrobia bacterium]|nr:Fic family protein [Elusimicrobiota bacterium]
MNTQEKLKIIQKFTGLTQTKLAERFGVSFAAFNSWWTGKSMPRPKALLAIDELFLEVTGQKLIPSEQLTAKKQALTKKSSEHKSVITEIINNPDIQDAFMLKLTYNTNCIEGSTLTEPDTAAILFDNAALPNKSLIEQLEVKNHQAALNYLFDYILKQGQINEKLILRLHGMLMNGIRPDAGAYRNHAVRILGVNLPTANYLKVPDLVPIVLNGANKQLKDVVASAALIHSQFEQIHPFSDGNGRIGRLLMSAMLLKANLAPAIIKQKNKQLYYTFLNKVQTKQDQSQLEDFLCDAITDGFRILERIDIK